MSTRADAILTRARRLPNGCLVIASGNHRPVTVVAGKRFLIARVIWEAHHGPIPTDLFILHHCDHGPCIEIDHLFIGTKKDNTQDMMRKGRNRNGNTGRTHCKWGHEFTDWNTYIRPDGRRACRTCQQRRSEKRSTFIGPRLPRTYRRVIGPRLPRTYCNHGHEMTPENSKIRKRAIDCRECANESVRKWRAKNNR